MENTREELLTKAILIATKAHKGQVDKAKKPYILHPLAVSGRVHDLEEKMLAILHDYIEDTDGTFDILLSEGFDNFFVSKLKALTRLKSDTYAGYILKLSLSDQCKNVKLADLEENMNLYRLLKITNSDIKRKMKYSKFHSCLTFNQYTDDEFDGVTFELYSSKGGISYTCKYRTSNQKFYISTDFSEDKLELDSKELIHSELSDLIGENILMF